MSGDGRYIDAWWDRTARSWIIQIKDAEGNAVGPGKDGTAWYEPNSARKDVTVAALAADLGIPVGLPDQDLPGAAPSTSTSAEAVEFGRLKATALFKNRRGQGGAVGVVRRSLTVAQVAAIMAYSFDEGRRAK